ncbi:MAG: hypothetical protein DRJ10_12135 [Bacteroidetes bacterium]|nr:MAG: hypothetical protein DRJ10_12135 [Bacteroidota bacterium]
MKKAIFTFVFLISFVALQAQLNPINNLGFDQYVAGGGSSCPFSNCFTLSWEAPDTSIQDTLIGYNIYRNSVLFRFQEYTDVGCIEGPPPPCPDADFVSFDQFWMKVTAVYNSSLAESIANDSIYFMGIVTNIDIKHKEKFEIANNPVIRGNSLNIKFLNEINKNVEISVVDYQGQRIRNLQITRESNSIGISTDKLNTGIYIIVLSYEGEIVSKKIMII